MEDLTEGLFLALTYVALCMKYLNFLTRQREMRALLDRFRFELCQPRNSAEESILRQYDRKGILVNPKISAGRTKCRGHKFFCDGKKKITHFLARTYIHTHKHIPVCKTFISEL